MTLLCDQSSNIINLRDFINSLTDNIQDVSVRWKSGHFRAGGRVDRPHRPPLATGLPWRELHACVRKPSNHFNGTDQRHFILNHKCLGLLLCNLPFFGIVNWTPGIGYTTDNHDYISVKTNCMINVWMTCHGVVCTTIRYGARRIMGIIGHVG